MFELPEMITLAKQMNLSLKGKTIRRGTLGNSLHKFLWYNRSREEFERLTRGKVIGEAWAKARWLFIPIKPGYVLLLGECGGKILFHPAGSKLPSKYHLYIDFEDDSFFTATTQMWGAMELYEEGEEQKREYVQGMRTIPTDPDFTFEYFNSLIDELLDGKKRSTKALLTQDQIIPGLGNAIAQDILFRAHLHPRHPIDELAADQLRSLYDSIVNTVADIIKKGGRYDEFDLFGERGGYARLMDKNAVGRPCPVCGGAVEKIQYLGGACYLCSNCQQ